MMAASNSAQEPVRLLFEMTRDDNPRLYDDLIRFNKGTKRVNRLRFLAHEGLLAQHWLTERSIAAPVSLGRTHADQDVNPSAARHTNQAFETP